MLSPLSTGQSTHAWRLTISEMGRYGGSMLRLPSLKVFLALALLITPLASSDLSQGLLAGWQRLTTTPSKTAMKDFLQQTEDHLDDPVELALWWSDRGPENARAIGHWWAATAYQLAPRRVYPLLTVEEIRRLPRLAPDLRAFLIQRSHALAERRSKTPTAVLSWGPPTPCQIPMLPDAIPILEAYVGCLVIPSSVAEPPGP